MITSVIYVGIVNLNKSLNMLSYNVYIVARMINHRIVGGNFTFDIDFIFNNCCLRDKKAIFGTVGLHK